jgi:hypothetical protein
MSKRVIDWLVTLGLMALTVLSAVAWWSLDFATYPLPVRYLAAGTTVVTIVLMVIHDDMCGRSR